MSVRLFIQDHSGDHNFDRSFPTLDAAASSLMHVEQSGGYWLNYDDEADEDEPKIFVPWHRVDFARIENE